MCGKNKGIQEKHPKVNKSSRDPTKINKQWRKSTSKTFLNINTSTFTTRKYNYIHSTILCTLKEKENNYTAL